MSELFEGKKPPFEAYTKESIGIGCLGMAEDAMMEILEEILAKYESDETLGMIVRDTWIAWARRQPNPKPEWLDPWEKLPPEIQEVDRLIGIAIKRRVLAVLAISDVGPNQKTPSEILHASAPKGYKCSDCTMDKEPCPVCYQAWWKKRHPNTFQV